MRLFSSINAQHYQVALRDIPHHGAPHYHHPMKQKKWAALFSTTCFAWPFLQYLSSNKKSGLRPEA